MKIYISLFIPFIIIGFCTPRNFYKGSMKEKNSTHLVLIVDDNDKYAKALENYFQNKNIPTDRAKTAKEGYEMFHKKNYSAVVTDVTMETQTSGLWFARKIYKEDYKGKIIIASTGFDVFGVLWLGRYLLPCFAGVGWMVPKKPLKAGRVEFYPTYQTKEVPF